MEREKKPVCNIVDSYTEGLLVQMSDLMAAILNEILYLEERLIHFCVTGKPLAR